METDYFGQPKIVKAKAAILTLNLEVLAACDAVMAPTDGVPRG
jgi:hypothetical protein